MHIIKADHLDHLNHLDHLDHLDHSDNPDFTKIYQEDIAEFALLSWSSFNFQSCLTKMFKDQNQCQNNITRII